MNIYWRDFFEVRLKNRLHAPFPFYLNDDRKNIVMILGINVILILFMVMFGFKGSLRLDKILTSAALNFIVLTIHIIVLPKLFPKAFDAVHWTLGNYISFTIWQIIIIGAVIGVSIYWIYPHHPDSTLWESILETYRQVAKYSLVLIVILTMFLRNIMLQQSLRDAIKANQELEKIETLKKKDQHKILQSNLVTIYSDTSEIFSLNLPGLLFVEADDNYSTFFWNEDGSIQKKLLRVNLKNVEGQLNNSFILRCHRSFIVNINAISHVTGNANGYKLNIRDTDFSIPISRAKGKEVIGKIRQLLNVIELY